MISQSETGNQFKHLHEREGCFVIPNPWDAGSAKILAHYGFEALATTSAGVAFSLGRRDSEGLISRDDVLNQTKQIVLATDLPVSADLENGYSNEPEQVAQTIELAAQIGLVGGSIEDTTLDKNDPIREIQHAADCVRAAVEAKNKLPFPFTLTARAENYLYGRPDLNDTIKRLQAYQEAGADVLYAPGLRTKEDISAVVTSVDRPVNVIMGARGVALSVTDVAALGVKRISLGSSLVRAALGEFIRAVEEIKQEGTFGFAENAASFDQLNKIF